MVKNNKGRKTTLEERIAIVEHCTANAKNYSLTAKEYRYRYREHSGCTHACRKCVYHLRSGESLPMAEGFCRSEKNEYRSFRVSKAALMERNQ